MRAQRLIALAVVWVLGAGALAPAWADDEAASPPGDYMAELKAAAAARAKDPAWKPACEEVALIQVGDRKQPGALRNFCLDAEGNILACYAAKAGSKRAEEKSGVRVYSPDGKLTATWPLEIGPGAIGVAKDGSVFVAGDGRVLKLDRAGRVVASAASPVAQEPVVLSDELVEMLKEMATSNGRSLEQERRAMTVNLERRRAEVTGLAVTEEDVFIAVGAPNDFTYRVYRFNHALEEPKLVVEKLRGCCGQMDLQGAGNQLWIPHNARHRVEAHDREGKELTKFGKAGRVKAQDFGGCCEPKNLRVLANGDILAAESGPPTCIKRFSSSGKFLGVVAVVEGEGDCVRVTVDASADGRRFYLLDTTRDAIRVFGAGS